MNDMTESLLDHANRRRPAGLLPRWRGSVRVLDADVATTASDERALARAARTQRCRALERYHMLLALPLSARSVPSWDRHVELAAARVVKEAGRWN